MLGFLIANIPLAFENPLACVSFRQSAFCEDLLQLIFVLVVVAVDVLAFAPLVYSCFDLSVLLQAKQLLSTRTTRTSFTRAFCLVGTIAGP